MSLALEVSVYGVPQPAGSGSTDEKEGEDMSELLLGGIDKSTTVGDLLGELDRWGAAHAEVVYRDAEDVAIAAVIIVQGIPETGEIVAAVESLQEKWDADDEPPA